jgi:FAD dependent oxidoreductase TIGR03364
MYDLIIVGAGIAGLAVAMESLPMNKKVLIIEKNSEPSGASIRNFGMVLPLGMPAGNALNRAMKSRDKWLEYSKQAKFWANPSGMFMAAHHEDEMLAMEEFHNSHSFIPYQTRLLTPEQASVICPGVNPRGLMGGLFSQTEVQINPVQAIKQLTRYLQEQDSIEFCFSTRVLSVKSNQYGVMVETPQGDFHAKKMVCCPGYEFSDILFEETQINAESTSLTDEQLPPKPITCKLQMMRTVTQRHNWAFGAMMSTGLSMLHYPAFDKVESLKKVRDRVEYEYPELVENGIHILAAQNQHGEITIGDSHHYGDSPDPFINQRINQHILDYAQKVMKLPSWEMKEQWVGIYSKSQVDHVYWTQPQDHVFLITGLGGTGMSTSFAIAEEWCTEHLKD